MFSSTSQTSGGAHRSKRKTSDEDLTAEQPLKIQRSNSPVEQIQESKEKPTSGQVYALKNSGASIADSDSSGLDLRFAQYGRTKEKTPEVGGALETQPQQRLNTSTQGDKLSFLECSPLDFKGFTQLANILNRTFQAWAFTGSVALHLHALRLGVYNKSPHQRPSADTDILLSGQDNPRSILYGREQDSCPEIVNFQSFSGGLARIQLKTNTEKKLLSVDLLNSEKYGKSKEIMKYKGVNVLGLEALKRSKEESLESKKIEIEEFGSSTEEDRDFIAKSENDLIWINELIEIENAKKI